MVAVELKNYIDEARQKKVSDEQITNSLLSAGWPTDQVTAALAGDADLLVPPPAPSVAHVGMWTGFLYILFFISLYVLATSIGGIFHTWVDKALPTPNDSFTSYFIDNATLIQGYLAAIIVSYPVLIALAILLKKQLIKQPMVKNLRSRKILIYITLVGTFLIMLGEVISTIYDFLSGSVTGNVIGHLFVTVLIAGSIFGYYISEVKHDRKTV
jgi:MFS family permease